LVNLHSVWKNIPDIFGCSVKKNDQILVIFDKTISDTTGNQMTI